MKNSLLAYLYILITATFLFSGCSAKTMLERNTVVERREPIHVSGSQTISFDRIVFEIDSGSKLGYHHDGMLRIPYVEYSWQSISINPESFRDAASSVLRETGYSVVGGDDVLFGERSSNDSRFKIGCVMKDVQYNSYAPLAGGFSEARVSIDWQLFDTVEKNVVFQKHTNDYAKLSAGNIDVIILAFKNTLKQLLSKEEFVHYLE